MTVLGLGQQRCETEGLELSLEEGRVEPYGLSPEMIRQATPKGPELFLGNGMATRWDVSKGTR